MTEVVMSAVSVSGNRQRLDARKWRLAGKFKAGRKRIMTAAKQRSFVINPLMARTLINNSGCTLEELSRPSKLGLSPKTLRKILRGESVYIRTVRDFCLFFGQEVEDVLDPCGTENRPARVGDWTILYPLGPVESTPNRLQFRRYKLERKSTGEVGCGKRFILDHLTSDVRRSVQEQLLRHTNVCNQVGSHPNIAEHVEIKSASGDDLWWVIDEWIQGQTLAATVRKVSLESASLKSTMMCVASALAHLHKHDVVFRTLSPFTIMLSHETSHAKLIDFEMAKLDAKRPTVSPDKTWPEDDYRAPEIGGTSSPTFAADAYSWARVFLFAATGQTPPPVGENVQLLETLDMPRIMKSVVAKCLEINRNNRPKTMQPVLRALKRWRI